MKTKLLLYCTKRKPYLFNRIIKGKSDGYYTDIVPYDIEDEYLCGKIVAECECEVEEIYKSADSCHFTKSLSGQALMQFSKLSEEQLEDYLGYGENEFKVCGYALHLTNIKVFEKPLELSQCYKYIKSWVVNNSLIPVKLTKAPQNMMWVWYNGEIYTLISIRPEWLCKILNGEKTIEVRRKILKGMM